METFQAAHHWADDFLGCKCKRAPLSKDLVTVKKRLVALDRHMERSRTLRIRLQNEKARLELLEMSAPSSSVVIDQ
jgi:hypothetical protein